MAAPLSLNPYQVKALSLLSEAGVQFAIIGGMAMLAHGFDRPTKDLDLLVSRTPESARLLCDLMPKLVEGPLLPITEDELRLPRKLINLPSRQFKEVDILTSIGSLDTEAAWSASRTGMFGPVSARFLDLKELIYTKLAAAEANEAPEAKRRDLADLEVLLDRWRSAA